jgi:hypothetical protein
MIGREELFELVPLRVLPLHNIRVREEQLMPDLKAVLKQLQSQRADLESNLNRIDRALSALGSLDGRGRGRGGRRNMSAASRASIAAAQKKRWAKWRAEQKKAA